MFAKALLFLIAGMPVWALSNAVTLHGGESGFPSSQVTRIPRWFMEGEITGYPQPFVAGAPAAAWQADVKNRWPDGSVRYAIIHVQTGIAADSSVVVDFRSSADACHLGNQATCAAAALDGAGLLGYRGGAWVVEVEAEADPKGETTTRTVSARAMIDGGHFRYWLRGPLVTEVIVEDDSPSRSFDFGWSGPGCTQPYTSCAWNDDTTHRSLHPIFVLTFIAGDQPLRAQFMVANYWSTARQDQRYSVKLTAGSTEFTKTGIRGISSSWWRKVLWDGTAPASPRIDFNMEYMRASKLIPPYRLGVEPTEANVPSQGTHSINSTLSVFSARTNEDFPFNCTPSSGQCGNRTTTYGATGGRPDRGFYPLWEAQYLYSMRSDLLDVVIANAEYVASQSFHFRESGTGLANYHGSTPSFGMPHSVNVRTTLYYLFSGDTWPNWPAAVGPVSANTGWRGWTDDAAHRHTHTQLAYWLTGDWFFMQEQSFLAHISIAQNSVQANCDYCRKSGWAHIDFAENNNRVRGWLLWNLWRAALMVPDGDPQRAYLYEKLTTDVLAVNEGYYDIQDGDYYEPCAEPFSAFSNQSRWCHGRIIYARGFDAHKFKQVMLIGIASTGSDPSFDLISVTSPWMDNYVRFAFFDMCRTEGLGCPVARHLAEGFAGFAQAHPALLTRYRKATLFGPNTTLTAGVNSSATELPVADVGLCSDGFPYLITVGTTPTEAVLVLGKAGSNLVVQRNIWGGKSHSSGALVRCRRFANDYAEMIAATAMHEGGFPSNAASAGTSPTDMSYLGPACAMGIWSQDFARSNRGGEIFEGLCKMTADDGVASMFSGYSDPRWLILADKTIHQVQVSVGGTSATLRYVAPDGGRCRVYVGAAPPVSSSDAADPLDEAAGRAHTFTAGGLSPGEKHYRISCGVVRTSGTFRVQ